jgi:hypothetical protein
MKGCNREYRSTAGNPTMSRPEPTVTLDIRIPERSTSKFERERQAFYRLLPDLLNTHRGQYVAIHDGRIADSGPDRLSVAQRVLEKVGPTDIYVGHVDVEPKRPSRSGVLRDLERPKGNE